MNAVDSLGLSIGTTNLAAARSGLAPVVRSSVLTLRESRPAEVGVPSQNPELTSPNINQAGLVIRGFVERVGDPVPLVAADGSTHRGEALLTKALEALSRSVDTGRPPGSIVVAAPAHWGAGAVGALRSALRASPPLSPGGVAPTIVSDATAALAALQASPGLPGSGVVALCDFGASGSSVTLADAGANFAPIGETVRVAEFSGDQIDQALLNHVLAGVRTASGDDTAGTTAVGALTRLREECRLAKERLSSATATVVPVELPGYRSDVRLTRAELDGLIAEPFTVFLDALGDALERNRIPAVTLTAIATVGGGAAIPAVSQRLSEALRVPLITTLDPGLTAVTGAAVLASRGVAPDAPTGLAPIAADAPTSLAPAGWAIGAAGHAATESASDGSPSATYRALAWSQDEGAAEEPVPYAGGDYPALGQYAATSPTGARPQVEAQQQATVLIEPPLPWYRRPPLLFGIAAALAAAAVGGLAITLTDTDSTPTTTTTRVTKPGEPADSSSPAPPPVPVTTTITGTMTGSNGQTTVTTVTSTITPPPPSSTSPSSSTTTPTTTTTTPTTTTTTPTTTTTTPTTTRTTITTTAPPTTTAAPLTTTAAPPPTTAAPPPTSTVEPAATTQAAPLETTPVETVPTEAPAPATTAAPLE